MDAENVKYWDFVETFRIISKANWEILRPCAYLQILPFATMFKYCGKKQIALLVAILCVTLVIFAIGFGLILESDDEANVPQNAVARGKHLGGVATNGHECAGIVREIMMRGGSIGDAAVAAMLCEGVAMPQSTGLGGGFLMTIYKKDTGVVETLNAREVAPLAATGDMYKENPKLSEIGGLAVAVPGELRGYEYIHKKYGKLPWKDVVQPTINLCRNGHFVTGFLAKLFEDNKEFLKEEPAFREIYIDPNTGEPYREGQVVRRPRLARTLEIIAEEGADALYNGTLTQGFVEDIKAAGGIITEEDMKIYTPQWLPPVVAELPNKNTLYSSPLPGSGHVMAYILNVLKDFLDTTDLTKAYNWQRIVESFKFGYGKRTYLGDADFIPGIEEITNEMLSEAFALETRRKISDNTTSQDPFYYGANTTQPNDNGTAHISILAPNGDAVSITGTINLVFGARVISESTGIILNDEMDDFSSEYVNYFGLPSSPSNFIEPKKRPLSSMCPSIVIGEDHNVRMVLGAAGGSKITSSVALILMKHLWFGEDLTAAVSEPRLHHQLFPMEIQVESKFSDTYKYVMWKLKRIGHRSQVLTPKSGFAAITGVSKYRDVIEVVSDPRRPGSAIIFS